MTSLTRDALNRLPSRTLSSGRNRTKADVLQLEWNGEIIVSKDFAARGVFVRNTIGRFSISREVRAYSRLQGLHGIPRLLGRIDSYALAYGFIEGTPLPRLQRASLPRSFFVGLERLIASVHDRGVAVADLHHRNVIFHAPTATPALIDFSLAMIRPATWWNLPGRWLFHRALEIDRIALARIRARYELPLSTDAASPHPAASSAEERKPLPDAGLQGTRLYHLGRGLKRLLRRLRGHA